MTGRWVYYAKRFYYSETGVDLGLFVVRVGIGCAFMLHGIPSLLNEGYVGLAHGLEKAGLGFFGVLGAFVAKLIEAVGGMFLVLGLFTRSVAWKLAFVMLVAVVFHYNLSGVGFKNWAHPFELMVVCIGLTISGAGRYSLDKRFFDIRN